MTTLPAIAPVAPAVAAAPTLSIVMLSWNTRELLRACLASLFAPADEKGHGVDFEVIVVDNGSRDGSADLVAADFPLVTLKRNGVNEGYARGNNQGAALAKGRFLLLLNSDTEVQPGALALLVRFLENCPEYGGCAPKLVNPDGSVQRACMRFPTLAAGFLYDSWFERKFGRSRAVRDYFMEDFDHLGDADVDQPPGACFLIRRELWQAIGGFDERLWLFFNDVELCRRVRDRGLKIRYLARVAVLHHGGKSTSQYRDFTGEWMVNRIRYYRMRHGAWGVFVLKTWLALRALEEAAKVWKIARGADLRAGMGAIQKVVKRAFAA